VIAASSGAREIEVVAVRLRRGPPTWVPQACTTLTRNVVARIMPGLRCRSLGPEKSVGPPTSQHRARRNPGTVFSCYVALPPCSATYSGEGWNGILAPRPGFLPSYSQACRLAGGASSETRW